MTASTMSSRHLAARCSCWSACLDARHLRELTRRGHHALARWEATAPPASASIPGSPRLRTRAARAPAAGSSVQRIETALRPTTAK
jgi:hypothetical protein